MVLCPQGSRLGEKGICVSVLVCPEDTVETEDGQCEKQAYCPDGFALSAHGRCLATLTHCPVGSTRIHSSEVAQCEISATVCPQGSHPGAGGSCVIRETECPPGSARGSGGKCLVEQVSCPAGSSPGGSGCIQNTTQCPQGSEFNTAGQCIRTETTCPAGSSPGQSGCIQDTAQCPQGSQPDSEGQCIVETTLCPDGSAPQNGICRQSGILALPVCSPNAQGECDHARLWVQRFDPEFAEKFPRCLRMLEMGSQSDFRRIVLCSRDNNLWLAQVDLGMIGSFSEQGSMRTLGTSCHQSESYFSQLSRYHFDADDIPFRLTTNPGSEDATHYIDGKQDVRIQAKNCVGLLRRPGTGSKLATQACRILLGLTPTIQQGCFTKTEEGEVVFTNSDTSYPL